MCLTYTARLDSAREHIHLHIRKSGRGKRAGKENQSRMGVFEEDIKGTLGLGEYGSTDNDEGGYF